MATGSSALGGRECMEGPKVPGSMELSQSDSKSSMFSDLGLRGNVERGFENLVWYPKGVVPHRVKGEALWRDQSFVVPDQEAASLCALRVPREVPQLNSISVSEKRGRNKMFPSSFSNSGIHEVKVQDPMASPVQDLDCTFSDSGRVTLVPEGSDFLGSETSFVEQGRSEQKEEIPTRAHLVSVEPCGNESVDLSSTCIGSGLCTEGAVSNPPNGSRSPQIEGFEEYRKFQSKSLSAPNLVVPFDAPVPPKMGVGPFQIEESGFQGSQSDKYTVPPNKGVGQTKVEESVLQGSQPESGLRAREEVSEASSFTKIEGSGSQGSQSAVCAVPSEKGVGQWTIEGSGWQGSQSSDVLIRALDVFDPTTSQGVPYGGKGETDSPGNLSLLESSKGVPCGGKGETASPDNSLLLDSSKGVPCGGKGETFSPSNLLVLESSKGVPGGGKGEPFSPSNLLVLESSKGVPGGGEGEFAFLQPAKERVENSKKAPVPQGPVLPYTKELQYAQTKGDKEGSGFRTSSCRLGISEESGFRTSPFGCDQDDRSPGKGLFLPPVESREQGSSVRALQDTKRESTRLAQGQEARCTLVHQSPSTLFRAHDGTSVTVQRCRNGASVTVQRCRMLQTSLLRREESDDGKEHGVSALEDYGCSDSEQDSEALDAKPSVQQLAETVRSFVSTYQSSIVQPLSGQQEFARVKAFSSVAKEGARAEASSIEPGGDTLVSVSDFDEEEGWAAASHVRTSVCHTSVQAARYGAGFVPWRMGLGVHQDVLTPTVLQGLVEQSNRCPDSV